VASRWYNWGDKAFGETLAACRAAGVGRLVHCSTAAAVGVSEAGELVTEETPYTFEPDGLADPTQANNRVERRVEVGGAARVVRVSASTLEANSAPLRGREARLEVHVDAPTQVAFGGLTRAAGPNAPAMFSWRPLEAGVVQVAVQLEGDAAPTLWPVAVRTDTLEAPLVSATPIAEGVEVSWPTSVGEDGAYIERDGRPVGPMDAVVGRLAAVDVGVDEPLRAPRDHALRALGEPVEEQVVAVQRGRRRGREPRGHGQPRGAGVGLAGTEGHLSLPHLEG
jgi:hypothetical protein